jgi:hypothetical protein
MWGGSAEIDAESLYTASFGSEIPDETVYDDGFGKIEMMVDDAGDLVIDNHTLNKAVNVGAASGAAGYALTPIVWDRDVVDITRRLTPLLTLIPKVTNKGKVAQYYRITARGDAAWGDEDPALSEVDDTKEEASTSIKYLRITGRVTGVAQIAGAHFESSMQREVINKTQSVNEALEAMILTGENATNQYQPDGLQTLLTENTTDVAGAIALSDVTELVNQCFVDKGAPNLLITDPFTATDLIEQQMDYVRYTDPNITIAWGLQVPSIQTVAGRLPMLISQFMPSTTGSRRVFCINTNYIQRRVLQDITFERLAKTSDSEKFMLKTYSTLINKFPEGMGQLYGITN